ncbi:hypothetical protein NDU88_009796 [Pleurodeles waltl]|uniref:Uncharacterized protein n=1 Tax=Pleurodeles waltl TaxID=8319 RepID=A0AAV7RX48_PLEWA|nr:hypothetical protein NDU88_009796 [Pleurodeles waltl]
MGARGRNEIETNRRALAQRSAEQGRLREGLGRPCARRAAPRGLAESSSAHDGVAASSPYLSGGDGVRLTVPMELLLRVGQLVESKAIVSRYVNAVAIILQMWLTIS